LVEALRPERTAGTYPLAEVLFALQNQPIPRVELPGLAIEPLPAGDVDVQASFSVSLRLWEQNGTLRGGFGYNTALFDAATLERWCDRYLSLLAAVVADPERRLSELVPLDEAERRRIELPQAAPAEPRRAPVQEARAKQQAGLSNRRDSLSAAKRELLNQRLRSAAAGKAAPAPSTAPRPVVRTTAASPLVKLQSGDADRTPFFCVHAIGGSVFSYGELARRLDPGQPFYGLQAAGLDGGAPGAADVEAIAAEYVAAIRSVQAEGPYLLGGWSFGGVVAFEMARQLRAQGCEVGLLALLDSWAPVPGESHEIPGDADLLRSFLQDQAGMHGVDVEAPAGDLDALIAWGREAGLLKVDVRPEQVERLLAVYKRNLLAYASYRPQPAALRITLFRPDGAPPEARLHAANRWDGLAADGIEVHEVAGTHYTMLTPPAVQGLAERLGACIETACEDEKVRAS
jgi:thioesterase domain-containing protein